ncbi:hypothetical protein LCGC14_3050230 [marine sediment metagenome]|uniref:ParB-like N-terminal domain-containing protein n=1 Tax=marine sediment metagenome TaxID=412755 RepID=A0A0F8WLZ3_9ZZZZ
MTKNQTKLNKKPKEKTKAIIFKPLTEIFPYSQNPKAHTPAQVDRIVASIKEFGFCNPILVDENNDILAGPGRYKAAKKLKITEVLCVVLSHLTVKQKRAYRLVDNRLNEKGGEWDNEALTTKYHWKLSASPLLI